jgi:hypothetical protein
MKPLKRKFASSLALIVLLSATQLASAFYDPNLGRWLNRDPDPKEEAGEVNLYGYVENDPINSRDFFGLQGGIGAIFPPELPNETRAECFAKCKEKFKHNANDTFNLANRVGIVMGCVGFGLGAAADRLPGQPQWTRGGVGAALGTITGGAGWVGTEALGSAGDLLSLASCQGRCNRDDAERRYYRRRNGWY